MDFKSTQSGCFFKPIIKCKLGISFEVKMQKLRTIILSRYFWLAAAILLIISRLGTWLFPFDSDHWIFYYIGSKWVEGSTLYVDMWDHKGPIIYAYNGLLHILFGGNLILHRVFFTLVAIFGIWLFYKTSKLLYDLLNLKNKELTARATTLLYIFVSSLSQFTNSGNNNENLGILFLIATLYFYLQHKKDPAKQSKLFISGIFAGFVFMLKANFALLLLPLFVDLIYVNRKNIFKIISQLSFFAFGILAQLLFWSLFLYCTFKQFFIATFEFNSKYIKALGWDTSIPGFLQFIGILILLILFFAPFFIKALNRFKKPDKKIDYLLPLVALCSMLFIILAGTFYSHYFLITIPYLCLIAGATSYEVFNKKRRLKLLAFGIVAILMILISFKLGVYNTFAGSAALDAKKQTAAANYITDHTANSDRIFANVYGATFYRLTGRDSGSRYISASHPLIDYKYHFGYDFNTKFIFDMEDSKAKYVVMSSDKNDIYRIQNPVLMRYILHNYHLETTISGYDIFRRN